MKSYKNKALKENYKDFYAWLQSDLTEISKDLSYGIEMCFEEIFANIVFYAYPEKTGDIEVHFSRTESEIILEFIDDGISYNPLENPDPDISLPLEQRRVGGLGIFIVKQYSDEIFYERKDDKNKLILKFNCR